MVIVPGVCEVVVDTILNKWNRWKNKNEINSLTTGYEFSGSLK